MEQSRASQGSEIETIDCRLRILSRVVRRSSVCSGPVGSTRELYRADDDNIIIFKS